MTNHLRVVLPALLAFAAPGCSPPADDSTTSALGSKTAASIDGSNIPAESQIGDGVGHVFTLSGGSLHENGRRLKHPSNVSLVLFFDGVVYAESAGSWSSLDNGSWVSASDPRKTSANESAIPASKVLVDAKLDVWALSGGVVYQNGATAGYSANVISLVYSGGVIYQENSADDWWSWNGSTWVASSAPTGWTGSGHVDAGSGGAPDAGSSGKPDAGSGSPPPPAGTSWVYYQGKYDWSGDWDSGMTSNYDATPSGFTCLTGSDCLELTPSEEWGIWLPYPDTFNNPNDTLHSPGIGINISGYTYLTIAINPTKAGFAPTFFIDYSLPGQVDLGAGNCVSIAGGTDCPSGNYGPNPMVVGKWNVYNIPISAFNIGSVLAETNGWIYKFALQEHGSNADQTVYVDQVGFTTAPL